MDPKNPDNEPTNSVEEVVETPETEDYAGYGSLEAMKAAIYASRKEGKRLAETSAEQAARLAELERRLPSERSADRRSALDEIEELGLPKELFERAVDERMERALAPRRNTDAAVAKVRRSNPDFQRFEAEFTDWLADNPQVGTQYQSTVAASPDSAELALEGVFARFARDKASTVEKKPAAKISPDAALPSSSGGSGGARRVTTPTISREDRKELIKEARNSGDPVTLMRALGLGTVVPVHRDIERSKG